MHIAGREYTVVRPKIGDPRFHLAAVIVSLQVLGQTVLDFDISIAQILVALSTALLIGFTIGVARDRVIAWPASAVLAGNGVAFVLRVPGTSHGDWWSLRGWWIFAGAVVLSLASKYAITWGGRHIFNPSNFGLVATFLVLGSDRADPLPFWWGPIGPATMAALIVIGVGGVAILWRLRIAAIAVSFWTAFAVLMALVASNDHCMAAPWHLGPVCGRDYWWVIVTSPEVLVFLFFMITDPKTSPAGRVTRIIYGASIGVIAAVLAAPQSTEFATKVAILTALTLVCALRPFIEPRLPANGDDEDKLWVFLRARGAHYAKWVVPLLTGIVALLIVASPTVAENEAVLDEFELPARPTFDDGDIDVPAVRVNPTDRVAAAFDDERLQRIGRDVVEDLAILTLAQRERDETLLATAFAESELDERLEAFRNHGDRVDVFEVASLDVSAARRFGQGAPAVMVTLRGTVTSTDGEESWTAALHETYEVKLGDGTYLLTTDDLPPGFVEPE